MKVRIMDKRFCFQAVALMIVLAIILISFLTIIWSPVFFMVDGWEGFSIGSAYADEIDVEEEEANKEETSKFDLSPMSDDTKIVFLHSDLGKEVWDSGVRDWFKKYDKEADKDYKISHKKFPVNPSKNLKSLPCDYWNIWVNHAGDEEYKDCPTLEILTEKYDIIMFKHSWEASFLEEHEGKPLVKTRTRTVENYKVQYAELKKKMHEFTDNRFIVWTLPAFAENKTNKANAERISEFNEWLKSKWDKKGDNIFVWDFHRHQTDGGLYFKTEYFEDKRTLRFTDKFTEKIIPDLGDCIIRVIQGRDFTAGGIREAKIMFLHHSTGSCIWKGGVKTHFTKYNIANKTKYEISERAYPKSTPYGWKNYPYDYWNIWVNHAGTRQYEEEDTLEILTKEYDVIIFKHCYPVSKVEEDTGKPDITSDNKTAENYKLQYEALKKKMKEFPDTMFIVWTGAALHHQATNVKEAERAQKFFKWVRETWDVKGDNIFVWDFWKLETDDGLYLKDEYSAGAGNSHPGKEFSKKVAPLFSQRIINILQGKGDSTSQTGE